MSACLETLAQAVRGIRMAKREARLGACLDLLSQLSQDILGWFHKKHRTAELMEHVFRPPLTRTAGGGFGRNGDTRRLRFE